METGTTTNNCCTGANSSSSSHRYNDWNGKVWALRLLYDIESLRILAASTGVPALVQICDGYIVRMLRPHTVLCAYKVTLGYSGAIGSSNYSIEAQRRIKCYLASHFFLLPTAFWTSVREHMGSDTLIQEVQALRDHASHPSCKNQSQALALSPTDFLLKKAHGLQAIKDKGNSGSIVIEEKKLSHVVNTPTERHPTKLDKYKALLGGEVQENEVSAPLTDRISLSKSNSTPDEQNLLTSEDLLLEDQSFLRTKYFANEEEDISSWVWVPPSTETSVDSQPVWISELARSKCHATVRAPGGLLLVLGGLERARYHLVTRIPAFHVATSTWTYLEGHTAEGAIVATTEDSGSGHPSHSHKEKSSSTDTNYVSDSDYVSGSDSDSEEPYYDNSDNVLVSKSDTEAGGAEDSLAHGQTGSMSDGRGDISAIAMGAKRRRSRQDQGKGGKSGKAGALKRGVQGVNPNEAKDENPPPVMLYHTACPVQRECGSRHVLAIGGLVFAPESRDLELDRIAARKRRAIALKQRLDEDSDSGLGWNNSTNSSSTSSSNEQHESDSILLGLTSVNQLTMKQVHEEMNMPLFCQAGISLLDTHTMSWNNPRVPLYDATHQSVVKCYSKNEAKKLVEYLPFLSRHSGSTVYSRIIGPTMPPALAPRCLWGRNPQPLAWTVVIGGTSALHETYVPEVLVLVHSFVPAFRPPVLVPVNIDENENAEPAQTQDKDKDQTAPDAYVDTVLPEDQEHEPSFVWVRPVIKDPLNHAPSLLRYHHAAARVSFPEKRSVALDLEQKDREDTCHRIFIFGGSVSDHLDNMGAAEGANNPHVQLCCLRVGGTLGGDVRLNDVGKDGENKDRKDAGGTGGVDAKDSPPTGPFGPVWADTESLREHVSSWDMEWDDVQVTGDVYPPKLLLHSLTPLNGTELVEVPGGSISGNSGRGREGLGFNLPDDMQNGEKLLGYDRPVLAMTGGICDDDNFFNESGPSPLSESVYLLFIDDWGVLPNSFRSTFVRVHWERLYFPQTLPRGVSSMPSQRKAQNSSSPQTTPRGSKGDMSLAFRPRTNSEGAFLLAVDVHEGQPGAGSVTSGLKMTKQLTDTPPHVRFDASVVSVSPGELLIFGGNVRRPVVRPEDFVSRGNHLFNGNDASFDMNLSSLDMHRLHIRVRSMSRVNEVIRDFVNSGDSKRQLPNYQLGGPDLETTRAGLGALVRVIQPGVGPEPGGGGRGRGEEEASEERGELYVDPSDAALRLFCGDEALAKLNNSPTDYDSALSFAEARRGGAGTEALSHALGATKAEAATMWAPFSPDLYQTNIGAASHGVSLGIYGWVEGRIGPPMWVLGPRILQTWSPSEPVPQDQMADSVAAAGASNSDLPSEFALAKRMQAERLKQVETENEKIFEYFRRRCAQFPFVCTNTLVDPYVRSFPDRSPGPDHDHTGLKDGSSQSGSSPLHAQGLHLPYQPADTLHIDLQDMFVSANIYHHTSADVDVDASLNVEQRKPEWCDVLLSISAGGREKEEEEEMTVCFWGHMAIIAQRCVVLRMLLQHTSPNEDGVRVLEVTDELGLELGQRRRVFGYLLSYLYSDVLHSTCAVEDASLLLLLADQFQLPRLHQLCEGYLYRNITMETVGPLLQFSFAYNLDTLKVSCMGYVLKIRGSVKWTGEELDAEVVQLLAELPPEAEEEMEKMLDKKENIAYGLDIVFLGS